MTAPLKIHVGETFKKWTVIALSGDRDKWGKQLVICQCACGTVQTLTASSLRQRKGQGCLTCRTPSHRRHGHARVGKESPTHCSWRAMLDRCENPKSPSWQWYGAQGISVCAWWQSFENFLTDMGERPSKEYTIERKDRTLSYCPENCCWATRKDQGRNRSPNLLLAYQEQTLPLITWAEITGIDSGCIRSRLRYGWTVEQALSTPSRVHKPYNRSTAT